MRGWSGREIQDNAPNSWSLGLDSDKSVKRHTVIISSGKRDALPPPALRPALVTVPRDRRSPDLFMNGTHAAGDVVYNDSSEDFNFEPKFPLLVVGNLESGKSQKENRLVREGADYVEVSNQGSEVSNDGCPPDIAATLCWLEAMGY